MSIMINGEASSLYYGAGAEFYDMSTRDHIAPDIKKSISILQRMKFERPVRISVDLGCGNGQVRRAASELERIVSLDISLHMLRRIDDTARGSVVAADCQQLPVASGSVDGALMMAGTIALFDAAERNRIFAECRRVMIPGSPMMISLWIISGDISTEKKSLPILYHDRSLGEMEVCEHIGLGFRTVTVSLPSGHQLESRTRLLDRETLEDEISNAAFDVQSVERTYAAKHPFGILELWLLVSTRRS